MPTDDESRQQEPRVVTLPTVAGDVRNTVVSLLVLAVLGFVKERLLGPIPGNDRLVLLSAIFSVAALYLSIRLAFRQSAQSSTLALYSARVHKLSTEVDGLSATLDTASLLAQLDES